MRQLAEWCGEGKSKTKGKTTSDAGMHDFQPCRAPSAQFFWKSVSFLQQSYPGFGCWYSKEVAQQVTDVVQYEIDKPGRNIYATISKKAESGKSLISAFPCLLQVAVSLAQRPVGRRVRSFPGSQVTSVMCSLLLRKQLGRKQNIAGLAHQTTIKINWRQHRGNGQRFLISSCPPAHRKNSCFDL